MHNDAVLDWAQRKRPVAVELIKKATKPHVDLSWLTDDVVARMNHIRFHANLQELSKEEWMMIFTRMDETERHEVKRYVS